MSSEWVISELGKEAINASRPFSFKQHPNVVFVNTGDVLNGSFLHSDVSCGKGLPGQAKKALQQHDILLTEIRPGNRRFAYVDFDARKYVVSTKFMVIESLGRVSPRFLYHVLTNQSALNSFQRIAESRSGTFPQITFDSIAHYPVPIPPDNDQQKLVEFLDALDQRATLLHETNATLEAIAQALFKSWFVDFDPVRAKAEGLEPEGMDAATAALFPDYFEQSEVGLVPRGWKMSTLGAICRSNNGVIQTGPFGSQLHASDYVAEGVPVVMPKDISYRRVDATTAARILPEDANRLSRHQLSDGDILFSRRGDVEKHALISEMERGWLCGTGCLLVRPGTRRKISGYLSRSLDLLQTKKWLTQHAVGATMPNLNTGILSDVPVLLPADEVLAAFEQVASAFDARISESNATAITLTRLRDILVPRLISGQLRLPEAEVLVEEVCA